MRASNRIIVNTLAQYVRTIFNMVLSLYSTRLVLDLLGLEDYGLFTLVAGVVSMLSFVTSALVSSTQRFLSVAQGKGDMNELKYIFNNSIWLHVFFGIIFLAIFEALTPLLFNGFLNINSNRLWAAEVVYQQVLLMVFISLIASPYRALLVSHENIVYTSIIDMVDGILKVVFVVALVYIPIDKLIGYGWIMMLLRVFNFGAFAIYDYLKYEECIIPNIKGVDKQYLKGLTSFTGWTMYSAGCVIGRTQGIAIVLNKMLGTAINAAYGIALQISGYVSFVSSSLGAAINPQLMKAEGGEDRERMLYLARFQSKFGYFLLSMVAIPFMFEISPMLTLWLKDVPEYASLFTIMVLLSAVLDQLTMGLNEANKAVGNIKEYTLLSMTPKILPLPAFWICLFCGLSLLYCAISYVVIEIITMLVRMPLLKRSSGLNIPQYIKYVFGRVTLPTILCCLTCIICTTFLDFKGRFIFTFAASITIYGIGIYFFGLEDNEKQLVRSIQQKIFKKK